MCFYVAFYAKLKQEISLLEFRAYDKMVEGSLTFQQSKLIIQWCYIRQNALCTLKTVETYISS